MKKRIMLLFLIAFVATLLLFGIFKIFNETTDIIELECVNTVYFDEIDNRIIVINNYLITNNPSDLEELRNLINDYILNTDFEVDETVLNEHSDAEVCFRLMFYSEGDYPTKLTRFKRLNEYNNLPDEFFEYYKPNNIAEITFSQNCKPDEILYDLMRREISSAKIIEERTYKGDILIDKSLYYDETDMSTTKPFNILPWRSSITKVIVV